MKHYETLWNWDKNFQKLAFWYIEINIQFSVIDFLLFSVITFLKLNAKLLLFVGIHSQFFMGQAVLSRGKEKFVKKYIVYFGNLSFYIYSQRKSKDESKGPSVSKKKV